MLKPFHSKFAAVLLGAVFTLNSCSQKQDVQPSPQASVSKADVQVLNGRLVFADQPTFDRLQGVLVQKSRLKTSEQELAAWEQGLQFTSLRTTALKELAHLEALETAGQPAPAYELLDSFGFPDTYAAVINPAGEYQVGTKIYWFHKGFKYEASSEAELAAIKQEPTQAKLKYEAGSRIINEGHATAKTAARTGQTNNPYAYDKYVYNFNYQNDAGSRRRIIYATRVFSEYRGSGFNYQNVYTQYWYSSVSLLIKYEYYSFGRSRWYAAGDSFNWSTMINKFTGNAYIPYDQNQNIGGNYAEFASYLQGNFNNGLKSIELGSVTMAADANQSISSGDVYWSFEIAGGIICSPQYDSAHEYSVGNITNTPVIW